MTIGFCYVSGEWKLINEIQWDFMIDDERGCSLSMIHEDISYNDLIGIVFEDFGIDDNRNSVNLSYVSLSKLNIGSKEIPPVFIRNDRQVTPYLSKLRENGRLPLCVTIKRRTQISPLIVSNMIQPWDEDVSTHDWLVAESSNAFEVFITIFIFIMIYKNCKKYKILA
ncbi:hypothetical protein N665_0463s0007 [Sinapis alba]|nr:hypothetical protein N665_0463s0007 [Sinapis alba]